MKQSALIAAVMLSTAAHGVSPQDSPQVDTIPTSAGDLEITFIGHGTLMFRFAGRVIHVDPVMREADYTTLPKADLILVTHRHGDHLDPEAIRHVRQSDTRVIVASDCRERVESATVMNNGDVQVLEWLRVEAVPAYNVVHVRDNGDPFHPRGDGNGYVLTMGDTRVYVAGDTENVPEMKELTGIDVAFLPMNLPYTMTPSMVADAARAIRPRVLYPYHYGDTDTDELLELLANEDVIEVRVKSM